MTPINLAKDLDLSNDQLSFLSKITDNLKSLNIDYQNFEKILKSLPKKELDENINEYHLSLIRSGLKKGSLLQPAPGFKHFPISPFVYKMKFLKGIYEITASMPENILLLIFSEYHKSSDKSNSIYKTIKKKYSIDFPVKNCPDKINTTCSINDFNQLSDKYKYDRTNLFISMSICGIIITDEKIDLENDNHEESFDFKKINKFFEKLSKIHLKVEKTWDNHYKTATQLLDYLPFNNKYEKVKDIKYNKVNSEIKKLDRQEKAIKSLNEDIQKLIDDNKFYNGLFNIFIVSNKKIIDDLEEESEDEISTFFSNSYTTKEIWHCFYKMTRDYLNNNKNSKSIQFPEIARKKFQIPKPDYKDIETKASKYKINLSIDNKQESKEYDFRPQSEELKTLNKQQEYFKEVTHYLANLNKIIQSAKDIKWNQINSKEIDRPFSWIREFHSIENRKKIDIIENNIQGIVNKYGHLLNFNKNVFELLIARKIKKEDLSFIIHQFSQSKNTSILKFDFRYFRKIINEIITVLSSFIKEIDSRIKKYNKSIDFILREKESYNIVSDKIILPLLNEKFEHCCITNDKGYILNNEKLTFKDLDDIEKIIYDFEKEIKKEIDMLIQMNKNQIERKIKLSGGEIKRQLIRPVRRMKSIDDLIKVKDDYEEMITLSKKHTKQPIVETEIIQNIEILLPQQNNFDNAVLNLLYFNKHITTNTDAIMPGQIDAYLNPIIKYLQTMNLNNYENLDFNYIYVLLHRLFVEVNERVILNHVGTHSELTENIAKIIFLQSYLSNTADTENNKNILHDHFETIKKSVPNQYTQLFKIMNYNYVGSEYIISEKDESIDNQLLTRINQYFVKNKDLYTHELTKISDTNVTQKKVLNNMLKTLEKNYYDPIISGQFNKNIFKSKLFILSAERLWNLNKTTESMGFKNLKSQLRDEINKEFKPIIDLMKSLVDINATGTEYQNETIFYKNDLSDLTITALELKGTELPIALKKYSSFIDYDHQKIHDELSNYLLKEKEFVKTQPELFKHIYKKSVNSLDDLIKLFEIKDQEIDLENQIKNLMNNHDIYHIGFTDWLSSKKDQQLVRQKIIDLDGTLHSQIAQLNEDDKDPIMFYQENGRYDRAETIANEFLQQARHSQQFNKELYIDTKDELKQLSKEFHDLLYIADYSQYYQDLEEYNTKFREVVLTGSSSTDEMESYIELIKLITNDLENGHFDTEQDYYKYISQSDSKLDSSKKSLWELVEQIIKGKLTLDDNINYLIEHHDSSELFSTIKRIQPRYNMPSKSSLNITKPKTGTRLSKVDDYEIIYRKFSKMVGYYSDPNTEKCEFIGDNYQLPFIMTTSIKRLKTDSKIVIVLLNPAKKHKNTINNQHLKDLENEIYDKIEESDKKNNPLFNHNDYSIVCISLTRHCPDNYTIKHHEKFKSMTIIKPDDFVSIFSNFKTIRRSFRHLLIKSIPLKDLNPYSNNNSYNSNDTVYVQRSIRDAIFRQRGNVAIYGGRRIGKTSICKDILLDYENNQNSHALYLSVSTYRYHNQNKTIFREGLQIGEEIVNRLSSEQNRIELRSLSDFKDTLYDIYKKEYKGKTLLIIIDEFDRYIEHSNLECLDKKKDNTFDFVDQLRHLHEEEPNISFLISGFISLYSNLIDLNQNPYLTKTGANPFAGLITHKQHIMDMNPDEAKELILTLEHSLALEFKNEGFVNYIIQHTGNHPALIQCFCQKLINNIGDRITQSDRMIRLDDINDVLKTKEFEDDGVTPTYYHDFDEIIQMNFKYFLKGKSYEKVANALMIILCLMEETGKDANKSVPKDFLFDEFNDNLKGLGDDDDIRLKDSDFKNTIDILKINNVISEKDGDLAFIYSSWSKYLEKYKWALDKNYLDNRIIDAYEQIVEWNSQNEN